MAFAKIRWIWRVLYVETISLHEKPNLAQTSSPLRFPQIFFYALISHAFLQGRLICIKHAPLFSECCLDDRYNTFSSLNHSF